MKRVAPLKCSNDVPRYVVDDNAETLREMCDSVGLARSAMTLLASNKIREGRWERVWKRVDGRLRPAYRVIAQGRS